MAPNRDTPGMRQFDAMKRKYPDCILLFRMGDFYEMFDDDAVLASKVLGITLTERSAGIPMAGVPYHSYEPYVRRLLEAGHRVARCDQIQDARLAKGVVERAVTQIYTPGTLIDDTMLDDGATAGVAAVCFLDAGDDPDAHVGAGVVELSTGSFVLFDCAARELADELARLGARELIYAEPAQGNSSGPPTRVKRVLDALSIPGTPRPSWHFRLSDALELLLEHYSVRTLQGFGLADDDPTVPASGAIVRYLRETQAIDGASVATSEGHSSGSASAMHVRSRSLAHLAPPRKIDPRSGLILDVPALRSLEIERTLRSGVIEGSLLGVFQGTGRGCRTAMGRRLLRQWLVRPLAAIEPIEQRHACVATLVDDRRTANALAQALSDVQDVARLTARIGLGRASPRDLVGWGRSLGQLDAITQAIDAAPAFVQHTDVLEQIRAQLEPVSGEIARQCVDSPPGHLREGGLIRDGIDAELDEARALQRESGRWLAEYQKQLIESNDLPSLKVGFNKVVGYYIELPKAQARRAPDQFTRKQTLTNAERYITPELKDYEQKVTTASERAVGREIELFTTLCAQATHCAQAAGRFAQCAGELDVLGCFAGKAAHSGWVRAEMVDEPVLEIAQGRHPTLEDRLGNQFVPNDCVLGAGRDEAVGPALALITGPNMAGKSTYIRQVALITLLAQAGSFVPAQSARIGLTDRIFTRIGADDALHEGQSTFMIEMIETARVLHQATARSLVILDEIGRGTSTLDGLALAWAITEGLARPRSEEGRSPRTLFATHYHELTDIADRMPQRVRNLQVAVRQWQDQIIFVHRIVEGRASQSYGIHVAKLAGLPSDVVARAQEVLESLSVLHEASQGQQAAAPAQGNDQLALFAQPPEHPAMVELKKLELEQLSPMEAFDALRALKAEAQSSQPKT